MSLESMMEKFREKNKDYLDKIDFNGKNVMFTGPLKSMTRANAKKKLIEKGGIPVESRYGCEYVVATEFTSKKYKDAITYNIPIISETEFLRGIN